MTRLRLPGPLLAILIGLAPAPALALLSVSFYASDQLAQQHCPHDTVVWLSFTSGHYYRKGQAWSATAAHGAFVCKGEADRAGAREAAGQPPG